MRFRNPADDEVSRHVRAKRHQVGRAANESEIEHAVEFVRRRSALRSLVDHLVLGITDGERKQRLGGHSHGPPAPHFLRTITIARSIGRGCRRSFLDVAGNHWGQHPHHHIHLRVIGRVAHSVARPVSIDGEQLAGRIVRGRVRDCFSPSRRLDEQITETGAHHPFPGRQHRNRIADDRLDSRSWTPTRVRHGSRWHLDAEPVDRPPRAGSAPLGRVGDRGKRRHRRERAPNPGLTRVNGTIRLEQSALPRRQVRARSVEIARELRVISHRPLGDRPPLLGVAH